MLQGGLSFFLTPFFKLLLPFRFSFSLVHLWFHFTDCICHFIEALTKLIKKMILAGKLCCVGYGLWICFTRRQNTRLMTSGATPSQTLTTFHGFLTRAVSTNLQYLSWNICTHRSLYVSRSEEVQLCRNGNDPRLDVKVIFHWAWDAEDHVQLLLRHYDHHQEWVAQREAWGRGKGAHFDLNLTEESSS